MCQLSSAAPHREDAARTREANAPKNLFRMSFAFIPGDLSNRPIVLSRVEGVNQPALTTGDSQQTKIESGGGRAFNATHAWADLAVRGALEGSGRFRRETRAPVSYPDGSKRGRPERWCRFRLRTAYP